MAKAKDLKNGKMSKEEITELIEAGVIKQHFLQIVEGFNAEFTVEDIDHQEMTSFRTKEKFDMPVFHLANSENRFTVWGTSLLNALVLESETIDIDPVEKANGLPVYFRDEWNEKFSNLKRLSDYRNTDGSFSVKERYTIEAAIVTRSRVDETRWALNYKMYVKSSLFLEFEKQRMGDETLTWISEERIHEISKMTEEERTFTASIGEVTLPAFDELTVIGGADTDPRWARATFVIKKNW